MSHTRTKTTATTVKRLWHLLTLLSIIMGLLHWVRVRTPRHMILRTAKSISEALAGPWSMLGTVGLAAGLALRDPLLAASGLLGAMLSGQYLWKLTHAKAVGALREVQPPAAHRSSYKREPRWERNVVYWRLPEGNVLHGDLWLPPEGATRAGTGIVYYHGGGFFTSHKDFGTRHFFRRLAQQGYVIMDADYRLAPSANLLEIQHDARRALAWMKANAQRLGVDRVVLAGGSAGGLLALLVGYSPNHPNLTPPELMDIDLRVAGVISYYGIVDLTGLFERLVTLETGRTTKSIDPLLLDQWWARPGIAIAAWLKGVEAGAMHLYLKENAALMRLGARGAMQALLSGEVAPEMLSPITYAAPACPPTLLLHGEHDYLLPVMAARHLYQKLRTAGAPVTYLELPQTEHTFDLFLPQISPPARAALSQVERFLDSLAFFP